MVDESSRIGVIFATTARSVAEMPSVIVAEPVKRRIGITNYIHFEDYTSDELVKFMKQTIAYRRESDFRFIDLGSTKEIIDSETYPFTKQAFDQIVNAVTMFYEENRIEGIRPKEALEIMDKALRVAISRNLKYIDSSVITEVQNDVVEALKL